MKWNVCLLGVVTLAVLSACSLEAGNDLPIVQSGADTVETSTVQNWTLWEPFDSYNTSVWQKADWANGGMFNCGWKPDHVSFSSGKMYIRLDNVSSYGRPYSAGEYRTKNTFTYGTFEVNMKAVKKTGTVTSFFTYTGNPWDEIDVEILGKNTTQVQFNYFVNGIGGHEKIYNLGFDSSTGYHKYKIEWGRGWINWYVDGKWAWGVNNAGLNAPYGAAMPSHPMQIMANFWPGTGVDGWLGYFSYSGAMSAAYDYILYQPL